VATGTLPVEVVDNKVLVVVVVLMVWRWMDASKHIYQYKGGAWAPTSIIAAHAIFLRLLFL